MPSANKSQHDSTAAQSLGLAHKFSPKPANAARSMTYHPSIIAQCLGQKEAFEDIGRWYEQCTADAKHGWCPVGRDKSGGKSGEHFRWLTSRLSDVQLRHLVRLWMLHDQTGAPWSKIGLKAPTRMPDVSSGSIGSSSQSSGSQEPNLFSSTSTSTASSSTSSSNIIHTKKRPSSDSESDSASPNKRSRINTSLPPSDPIPNTEPAAGPSSERTSSNNGLPPSNPAVIQRVQGNAQRNRFPTHFDTVIDLTGDVDRPIEWNPMDRYKAEAAGYVYMGTLDLTRIPMIDLTHL